MAPDTDSPTIDGGERERDLTLRWSGRVSLTPRILAVNIFALLLLGGGLLYLDSYRARLIESRMERAVREAQLVARALAEAPSERRRPLLAALATQGRSRLQLFTRDGRLVADSRALGVDNFNLRDPERQDWQKDAARFMDAVAERLVGTPRAPLFRDLGGRASPDFRAALAGIAEPVTVWRSPERTPVITAAARVAPDLVLLSAVNPRDITRTVRDERLRLAIVLAIVTAISVLLSLFLARTIVRPLRRLARAAIRVRLGRAREVVVPRLPSRRDEIGMLARAVSDMSQALRARIDATEAFAADVTHELKNPLASLRSATDGLSSVRDEALRAQLLAVVQDDVRRLDRLITDISDASRLDAQLSRATFEPVDIAALIGGLMRQRAARDGPRIAMHFKAPEAKPAWVRGDGSRLERVFENLIDNAISFSPEDGEIFISIDRMKGALAVHVDDDGPGVPVPAREEIFRRFHSVRPDGETFGQHSGLGLAIARTIVEGHGGRISVGDRPGGGARFTVELPVAARP